VTFLIPLTDLQTVFAEAVTIGAPMTTVETEERFCPECSYNLRGLSGEQCPECGMKLSGDRVSPIPWEHRREIGRWKAFWRTVLLVTFRPARIARAVGGPVDEIAARGFRWVVLALVTLVAGAEIWSYGEFIAFDGGFFNPWAWIVVLGDRYLSERLVFGFSPDMKWEFVTLWSTGATLSPVILLGFAFAACGAFWDPIFSWGTRGFDAVRRRRVKAIGGYACAPLAWAPICVTIWGAWRVCGDSDWATLAREGYFVLSTITWLVIGIALLAAVWSPARLFGRATQRGILLTAVTGLGGLPIGLVTGSIIGLVVLPCVAGLVKIIVGNVRN
jgi:hypothetical protein